MQFSRVIAFFLAFVSLGMFAFAAPSPAPASADLALKRDNAAVESALNTLDATVAPIIVSIGKTLPLMRRCMHR